MIYTAVPATSGYGQYNGQQQIAVISQYALAQQQQQRIQAQAQQQIFIQQNPNLNSSNPETPPSTTINVNSSSVGNAISNIVQAQINTNSSVEDAEQVQQNRNLQLPLLSANKPSNT